MRKSLSLRADVMVIDAWNQTFSMRDIGNRRFMYNAHSRILILGQEQRKHTKIDGSHGAEFGQAGFTKGYDEFVRGWVGTGKTYPYGVIHFAPEISAQNLPKLESAFATLEMFSENGAQKETVVRAFGDIWEQPLAAILSPDQDRFTIYQLKDGDALHYHRFTPLEQMEKEGLSVEYTNYDRIYTAPLKASGTLSDTLENIYIRFNRCLPEDYTGRSLSISDVVVLHQNGEDRAFFVDRFGFAETPRFLGTEWAADRDRPGKNPQKSSVQERLQKTSREPARKNSAREKDKTGAR